MGSFKRLTLVAFSFAVGLTISVCPAMAEEKKPASEGTEQGVSDPLEGINRVTSAFNRIFRKVVADPLITTYKAVTPDPVEKGIANFAKNLTEPVTAASSLLQGDTENASKAIGRFVVNTTAGMGGVSDTASDLNITETQEDLGQAAGTAGVKGGAHIVLPILGPTNLRDIAGDVLTSLANPLHTTVSAANAGTSYAENREELESLTRDSVDPYVVERDAYEQNRVYKINNGQTRFIEIPNFEDDDSDTASQ
ncbi:MAG: VacJ family lipoprotein [Rhodospirillales bacterium]|nr:VacJ family lipoprotein [Rhodospirillales bacterium]